jgi:hypothetical protein
MTVNPEIHQLPKNWGEISASDRRFAKFMDFVLVRKCVNYKAIGTGRTSDMFRLTSYRMKD